MWRGIPATLRPVNLLLPGLSLLLCTPAAAISRVSLDCTSVAMSGQFSVQQLHATLDLGAGKHVSMRGSAAQVAATALPGLRIGDVAMDADYFSDTQKLQLRFRQLQVNGSDWQLQGQWQAGNWQLGAASAGNSVATLLAWLQPLWQPPADYRLDGAAALRVTATGSGAQLHAAILDVDVNAFNLQNEAGTVAAEKVTAQVNAQLLGELSEPTVRLRISSSAGQVLLGPVFLDLAAQPLALTVQLQLTPTRLLLSDLQLQQRGLLQASGAAEIARQPQWQLRSADLKVDKLQFPAAFASFLQLPLATTNFGALETRGAVSGALSLRDGALASVDADFIDLDVSDKARELQVLGLHGAAHWRAANLSEPAVSALGWRQLRVASLTGGPSTLQLSAHGSSLQLAAPARIAVFDGALAVQRFESLQLGSADVSLGFDASIEPISMQQLSVAFGWPAMAGKLSGRVPGLAFSSGVLSVAGDIVASVFDGQITVSRLQLRNLLGRFPRLTAEVAARQLDLEQITRTFPVGSITGRLDADVRGLELFDWSPVGFDAELYTTPGDKTRHRISQKAVNSIASLGGGGGLGGALQSGFLRFFDDFGYERVGLRCQLRNDVCLMSGIDKGGGTYYMVKGGGVPRIDVVGNAGRVAWSQLVSQVNAALSSNQLIVK